MDNAILTVNATGQYKNFSGKCVNVTDCISLLCKPVDNCRMWSAGGYKCTACTITRTRLGKLSTPHHFEGPIFSNQILSDS